MSLTFNLTVTLSRHQFGSVEGVGGMIIFKCILVRGFRQSLTNKEHLVLRTYQKPCRMFISFIRQTQLRRSCIFILFDTNKCFGFSLQPSSGGILVHKKSKRERPLLTKSRYEVIVKLLH